MSTIATRRRLPRAEVAIPVLGLAAAVATVIVGQAIEAAGGQLGAFSPPFYVQWDPHVGALAPLSIAVLAGAAALTPTWMGRLRRPPAFAVAVFVLALALGVSLNIARGGLHELYAIFQTTPGGSPEAGNEYLLGLPALHHGVRFYIEHFPSLFPSLPQKVTGNPPGPLVALHCWESGLRRRWRRSVSAPAR